MRSCLLCVYNIPFITKVFVLHAVTCIQCKTLSRQIVLVVSDLSMIL